MRGLITTATLADTRELLKTRKGRRLVRVMKYNSEKAKKLESQDSQEA